MSNRRSRSKINSKIGFDEFFMEGMEDEVAGRFKEWLQEVRERDIRRTIASAAQAPNTTEPHGRQSSEPQSGTSGEGTSSNAGAASGQGETA